MTSPAVIVAAVPGPAGTPAPPPAARASWRGALRRAVHVHRCSTHRQVGVFARHECRCGAVQLVWFSGSRVRWASTWAAPDAVERELRHHASEARDEAPAGTRRGRASRSAS